MKSSLKKVRQENVLIPGVKGDVLNGIHFPCIFLDYILQLIGVHRARGASGGQQISLLLNNGEVQEQGKFDRLCLIV